MAWDASRQNEKRSSRVYKDLNLNFSANPVTGDVATVTDVIAIKRSVRNLLLTNHYDRPFHPEIGSNVPHLLFENLTEGIYELQMMDANGCVFSITETLVSPQIPTIDLGENVVINLGETYTFQTTFNNINLQEISWTPSNSFDCSDCLSPTFLPLNDGNYTLFVSSEDDCTTTDSITITVNKFRHFFAPNAFSPNFDGHNDYFNLHGGSEVELIKKLTVFNRWGAVVFNGIDLESSVDLQGWDGTFNGKPVNPGVYVWVAEIQFLDGEVISYSGDLTITK